MLLDGKDGEVQDGNMSAATRNRTGVWRLWCEHSGADPQIQIQGKPLQPFNATNPDHVFEVHPITVLNGTSVVDSLTPIDGFKTKDAEQAFTKYERIDSQILPKATTIKLLTEMAG